MAGKVKEVEILVGNNYYAWSRRVKAALSQHRWWEAIKPGYPDQDDPEEEPWTAQQRQRNEDALNFIIQRVDDLNLYTIDTCTVAKDAWQKLEAAHTKLDAQQFVNILEELINTDKLDSVPMRDYIGKITKLMKEVYNVMSTMNNDLDAMTAAFLIRGLKANPKYDRIVQSFRDSKELDSNEVRAKLIFEDRQEQLANEKKKEEEQKEVSVYQSRTYPNRDHRDRNSGGRSNEERRYVCYACNKPGHIARNCDKFNDNNKNREDHHKKEGHKQHSKKHVKANKAEYEEESSEEEDNSKKVRKSKVCLKVVKANTGAREKESKSWYIDSGASDHISPHRDLFQDFDDSVSGTVMWGDGWTSPVKGKGSIVMDVSKECGGYQIVLSNVYYAPEIDDNLMSERQFDKKGFKIVTESGEKKIMDKSEVFLIGHWNTKAKMYDVKVHDYKTGSKSQSRKTEEKEVKISGKRASIELWHARMGHMKQLPDACEVSGEPDDCETCLKSKSKKKPFPARDSRAKEVLDLVHTDLCSIKEKAPDGSKCFITFLDDYSRFSEVRILKSKDEAFESFKKYLVKAERFHNKKLKILQSDNGGEYISNDFNEFLEELGIDRRLIVPHNPEQNGRSERLNQTLLSITRCLLIHAGLPKMFWPHAVMHANFLRNRIKSRVIDKKTPFELWNGRELEKDDLKLVKVFGSEVWVRTGKDKTDVRGVRGIYLGVKPGVKGVKVWFIKEKKLDVAVHVDFREEKFPWKKAEPLPQPPTPPDYNLVSDDEEEEQLENQDDVENQENTEEKKNEDGGGAKVSHQNLNNEPENSNVTPPETPVVTENPGEENGNPGEENQEETEKDIGAPSGTEEKTKPPLRRSTRIRQHKPKCICCNACTSDLHNAGPTARDPTTTEEALSGPDACRWREAMHEELQKLMDMDTWRVVPRPPYKRIVDSKWVYRRKLNEFGEIVEYKARLVARGFSLTPGIDYEDDTYSPVIRKSSIRLLLAIAVEMSWVAEQLDVKSAYLNSSLQEPVYMEQPQGCEVSNPSKFVCMLNKSMYGLPQSAKNWNDELDTTLQSKLGMTRSQYDACVYFRQNLIIGMHVDDFIVIGLKPEVDSFKKQLHKSYGIKELGQVRRLLSLNVNFSGNQMFVDQHDYIHDLLILHRLDQAKGLTTILSNDYQKDEDSPDFNETVYRNATGSLLHLANCTRPDISFATSALCQRNHDPKVKDWVNVKHLMRYLKHTQNMKISYKKSGSKLVTYVDADWANDQGDRRSTTGYVISLANGPISWKSKKQTLTAHSSNDAEYIALNEVSKEVLHFQGLLRELGLTQFVESPAIIFIDNQGAKSRAESKPTKTKADRSKYIEIKYHLVKDEISRGKLKLEYVESANNLADILTKVLSSGARTEELAKKIGLITVD